jgi:branched-chain amino acid transport system permease protein
LTPPSREVRHLAGLAAVVGGVALVPVLATNAFYFHVLFMLGIYYVAAAGLNILVGFTGQKSLGHAGLFGVGAYTAALASVDAGLGPWVALLAAPVVGGLFGLVIAAPAVRVSGPSLAMVTLGFGIIAEKIASEWSDVFGGQAGIYGIAPLTAGGRPFTEQQWVWFVIALAAITHLLLRALIKGKYGRAFLAVQLAEPAAAAVGISIRRTKVLAFVISAVTCATAGALVAQNNQYFNSEFITFGLSIFLLLVVIVGGSRSIYGPLLGAALLTVLDAGLARWPALQNLVYGALLLFVLYALPDGIAGALAALRRRALRRIGRLQVAMLPAAEPRPAVGAAAAWAPPATPDPGGVLLAASGLQKRYGGVVCLADVDLNIAAGRIHALIGPNGAGKTTLLNVLSGHVPCDGGSIRFRGRDVTRAMAHQVAAAGAARTFQNLRLFTSLTVLDNVLAGAHLRVQTGLIASLLSLPGSRRAEARAVAQAMELLRHLGIAERAYEPAGALPYGLQRRVELARALASQPHLLLLDEPAAGLNPHEIKDLSHLLQGINRSGVTILLIEHHMDLVMGIADHVIVLDGGVKIAEGTPTAIAGNAQVIAAYLGAETVAADDRRVAPAQAK